MVGLICQVYYKAREVAINNGQQYHLAAILRRGKQVVRVGTNTQKTHPKFKRTYSDGSTASHMHAEMSVLRFAKPGDTLEVMRFAKQKLSMARPCQHCMEFIRQAGIKKVRFTNVSGAWEELRLK